MTAHTFFTDAMMILILFALVVGLIGLLQPKLTPEQINLRFRIAIVAFILALVAMLCAEATGERPQVIGRASPGSPFFRI